MPKDILSDKDKALFRQMMQSVKPLKQNKTAESVSKKPPSVQKRIIRPEEISPPELYLSSVYTDEVDANTLLTFCRHSIPRRRFSDLAQGKIPWQGRLDLHGQRTDTAQQLLINCIFKEIALFHRCLLIIHGKGNHNGKAPVLKNLVNHWLRQISQVLAFHSALPKDGGTGALYVLLAKNREF